ncbi:MAG: molybdopterin-synthase adenylyltransferase MoeB [Myxococcota bacterium]|nr:molybdopterin-synthase adenylyltransferase MoeB [Myxococcota bacterium]
MGVSFSDYLARTKAMVREITADDLSERLRSNPDMVVVDVREKDEHEQGVVPGSKLIPRGLLELKIENTVPDRSTPVALICAGGTRSALAARSLLDLGYQDVVSVAGGFAKYAQGGHHVEVRRSLTTDQRARYSRHLLMPEVGEEGQLKLLDAKVLCVGAGGLGSPAALYLAAAGIGTLGIIDADTVDKSNLQRQILHTEDRVGEPKVDSAEKTLKALNSDITVRKHRARLTSENVMELFSEYDIILDGTDNFPTRYLINDACVWLNKPNVHGSIYRFEGQATVFWPGGGGPCYRCLYPEPPPPELAPSCQEAGVLGVLPGLVGVIEAIEVVKLILGKGTTLTGKMLTLDTMSLDFRKLRMRRDPDCPVCSDNPTITELIDYEQFCSFDG